MNHKITASIFLLFVMLFCIGCGRPSRYYGYKGERTVDYREQLLLYQYPDDTPVFYFTKIFVYKNYSPDSCDYAIVIDNSEKKSDFLKGDWFTVEKTGANVLVHLDENNNDFERVLVLDTNDPFISPLDITQLPYEQSDNGKSTL